MIKTGLILSALIVALAGSAGAREIRSYSATAFDLEGGQELYVEEHVETWVDGRLTERQVEYVDPKGDLIAEKVVRYDETTEAPSFEMVDRRFGLREGADVANGVVTLYSGPVDEQPKRRTVDRPGAAVIDAGFDAFMRENLASIVAGESLEFDFAVPALRRFLRFQLLSEGRVSFNGAPAYKVKMRPAAALLRILVDPIELTYGEDGRLLEFRGLANVVDRDGDRYEARIVFDYSRTVRLADRVGAAR